MATRVKSACSPEVADAIIAAYADALRAAGSLLVLDETIWLECEQQARDILMECQRALHDNCIEFPAQQMGAEFASMELGARRAIQHIPAMESVRAGRILAAVVLDALPDMLAGMPADLALSRMRRAVQALHQAIDARVGAASIGYDAFLMRGSHGTSSEERVRTAREIHDRIGSNLSLALRLLELHQVEQGRPEHGPRRVDDAKAALQETFRFTRELVNGLRSPQADVGLRAQLMDYAMLFCPSGTEVDIQVQGDTNWLTPLHHDEAFLVTRECLRNAFAHSGASLVHVRITITPHALKARVTDNGKGINLSGEPVPPGNGMTSMRERVTLLGGTLALTSSDGKGTCVRFHIPLHSGGTDRTAS